MPVTIKSTTFKYKNHVSGEYQGVDAIAETTTSQQVAAIENAGSAAEDAIDAKKDAALAVLTDAAEMEDMQAGTFSTSVSYTAGQYVIQPVTVGSTTTNKLYRFTADHAAGAWTGTDVVEVKLGNDVSDLKSAITSVDNIQMIALTPGYLIVTNKSVGDTIDLTPVTNANLSYALVDVSNADYVTINGTGSSYGRLWAFVDSSNKLISVADSNTSGSNLILHVPAHAVNLVLNVNTANAGVCYVGRTVDAKIADVSDLLDYKRIEYTQGFCIATNISAGATVDYTPFANGNIEYAIVDVSGYSKVTFNGIGWSTGRLWAFVDAENKLISNSAANVTAENLIVDVPATATKLISNMFTQYDGGSYLGVPQYKTNADVQDKFTEIDTALLDIDADIDENTADISDIYSQLKCKKINYTTGAIIATNVTEGATVDLTPVTNVSLEYAIVDVAGYTHVTFNGTGWSNGRLWAFVDSENKLISNSAANVVADNLIVEVPTNATKLISNMFISVAGDSYLGIPQYKVNSDTDTEIKNLKTIASDTEQTVKGNMLFGLLNTVRTLSLYGLEAKINGDGSITLDGTTTGASSILIGTIPQIVSGKYYNISGLSANSAQDTTYWIGIGGFACDKTAKRVKANTTISNAEVRIFFKSGQSFTNETFAPVFVEMPGNSFVANIMKIAETEILQQFNNSTNISGIDMQMAITDGFDIDADGNLYVGAVFSDSFSEQTPGTWTAHLITANIGDVEQTKQVIQAFSNNEYCAPLDGYMKDYQWCCAKKTSDTTLMVYTFCYCVSTDQQTNYNTYVAKEYNLLSHTFGAIQLMDIDVEGTTYPMYTKNIVGQGISDESMDNFEAIWTATGIEHPAGYGGAMRYLFYIQINPVKYNGYWYASCCLGGFSHALCKSDDLIHWEYVCDIPLQQATEEVAICIYNGYLYATSRGNIQVDGKQSQIIKCPVTNLSASGWSDPVTLAGCRGERPAIVGVNGFVYVLQCINDAVIDGKTIPRNMRRMFALNQDLSIYNFIDLTFYYPILHPTFFLHGGNVFTVLSSDKRCYAVTTEDADGRSDLSFTRLELSPMMIKFDELY